MDNLVLFHPGKLSKWSMWSSSTSYCPASDLPFQNISSPEKKKHHHHPPPPQTIQPYFLGYILKEMRYLITCVKRRKKRKEKKRERNRKDKITENAFPLRAGLMLFNKWFIWLSKFRNALWIRGFSHAFNGKTGKIPCSTETSFLKHIGKENPVFLLFRDDMCLQLYPSASASGATPTEGMCLQRKLVLTCTSERNSNHAVRMVSGKFRGSVYSIPHCTLAAVVTLHMSRDAW